MFKLPILAICVAVATAQGYGQAKRTPVRVYSQPSYRQQVDYNEPIPYTFSYDIKDDYNNQQNRQESGDGYGNVKGSYGYQDGYGIYRQVEYTADDYGFRAQIKTNEPGTDNQNPADVDMHADPVQVKHQPKNQGYGQAQQTSYAPAHERKY